MSPAAGNKSDLQPGVCNERTPFASCVTCVLEVLYTVFLVRARVLKFSSSGSAVEGVRGWRHSAQARQMAADGHGRRSELDGSDAQV